MILPWCGLGIAAHVGEPIPGVDQQTAEAVIHRLPIPQWEPLLDGHGERLTRRFDVLRSGIVSIRGGIGEIRLRLGAYQAPPVERDAASLDEGRCYCQRRSCRSLHLCWWSDVSAGIDTFCQLSTSTGRMGRCCGDRSTTQELEPRYY